MTDRMSIHHNNKVNQNMIRKISMIVLNSVVWGASICGSACYAGNEVSAPPLFGPAAAALQRELDDTRSKLYGSWPDDAPVGLALLVSDGKNELFLTSHLPDGVTADSHYRIASLTKNFTAAAVLLLVQEGKMNLDDTVVSLMPGRNEPYLPATPDFALPHKERITIRQLLQHNAAVYDLTNDEIKTSDPVPYANGDYTAWVQTRDPLHCFTVAEMIGVQARYQLAYGKPGDIGYYSNMGYALLSLIVERVAEMDFAGFIRTRLLAPNGLQNTTLPTSGGDRRLPEPFLPGFRRDKNGAVRAATERNPSIFQGSGNMVSTPHDISRWLRRLNAGQAGVAPEMITKMRDCGSGDYGLGTMRFNNTAYGHNGSFNGYFACHYFDVRTNLSWVLICNALIEPFARQVEILNDFQRKMLDLYQPLKK